MQKLYLWQEDEWPNMYWQDAQLRNLLAEVNMLRGQLCGRLTMLGMREQNDSLVDTLTKEIVFSSEIEGQMLNRDSVRSSVARQLGIEYDGLPHPDHYVEGIVQVMLDATQHYEMKISAERLFGWHAALFPSGYSGSYKISVAKWREGEAPMQVVSGALNNPTVHFEAPSSKAIPAMMDDFLFWMDDENQAIDPLVKAAIAHLWFITIHPFDDGNGRICRTLTELLLSRADRTTKRFYSLSSAILNSRNDYYRQLESAQKGELDVTDWIEWFLITLKKAITESLGKTDNVIRKTAFWDKHRATPLNDRQRKVINKLFDGFEGKLNSSKWYKMNHCSQDTANRDIKDLINKGILRCSEEGGRSTSYELCE